jgi:hypothetical protein
MQEAPVIPHAATAGPQIGGFPTHALPEQQSEAAAHLDPSAAQAEVHKSRPVPSSAHVPLQQSTLVMHTILFGRHDGATPGSQRFVASSHRPQHGWPPPEVQFSPLARQIADDSRAHLLPLLESHSLEQQSASTVQFEPTIRHSMPPQRPLWHASEQQSLARAHETPS